MKELLFLLLPVAALSGWWVGQKSINKNNKKRNINAASKYFSGLSYILNEQPERAVDHLLQALDLNSEMVEIHLMLGNLFRKKGEVDRAIKVHKSILVRPNLPKEYCYILKLELAKDYMFAGLLDRAELILLELVDNNAELESSLNLLISIYQESKDWDKAIECTLKLQSISKKNYGFKIAHFYCEIAEEQLANKNFYAAKKNIKNAIYTNKGSVRANIILADIEIQQKNYKTALKLLENILPNNPPCFDDLISKIVLCHKELGTYFDIDKYWAELLKKNRDIKLILIYVHFIQIFKGESFALKYLMEYLNTNPSILALNKFMEINFSLITKSLQENLDNYQLLIGNVLQKKHNFKCIKCGFASKALEWQCPGCKNWDSFKTLSLFEIS